MIGLTTASIIGIFEIIWGLFYLGLSAVQVANTSKRFNQDEFLLRIFQLLFLPIIFLLSGLILLFQGWRLDPILQFQQILITTPILYFTYLDTKTSFITNQKNRRR